MQMYYRGKLNYSETVLPQLPLFPGLIGESALFRKCSRKQPVSGLQYIVPCTLHTIHVNCTLHMYIVNCYYSLFTVRCSLYTV